MDDEELKRLIREDAAETRRHMDVVIERQGSRFDAINEAIDRVEGRLDGVGGRLDGVEGRLDGVEGRLGRVEETIARESSETRSMIRLSYTELDRRLRSLEERVERLEQTIH